MAMGVRDLTQIWKGMDSRLRGNDFGDLRYVSRLSIGWSHERNDRMFDVIPAQAGIHAFKMRDDQGTLEEK
jgi:hypothetical protein